MTSLFARAWRTPSLLLCVAVLFWAGNSIAGRALAGVVPPLGLSFWRWTVALALVTPVAWKGLREDWPTLVARWPLILLLAATGVASFGALLYIGLETTTALNSVLLQAAFPPLILLFAWVFQGERTGRQQIAGVALSMLGVLVVISHGRPWDLLHLGLKRGDAIISLGVVIYAAYVLILRRRPPVRSLSLLWATFAVAVVMLAPFYLWETLAGNRLVVTPTMLAGLAYVAIFPSFLAYLFFNRAVDLIGPTRAGHYTHLMPVFGGVLAVVLLGEAFAPYHAVGAVLIGAGIVAANFSRRPKA